MQDVVANPRKAGVAIAVLHEINAVQAEHRSRQIAQAESERAASKARTEVVEAGEMVLEGIFARLEEIARENLSEARVSRASQLSRAAPSANRQNQPSMRDMNFNVMRAFHIGMAGIP